jgi:hypothetical protein
VLCLSAVALNFGICSIDSQLSDALFFYAVAPNFGICSIDSQLSDALFFYAVALQFSAFDDPQGCGSM